MNKLKQIKALVEEAMTELESNTRRTTRAILTDLAKKSAEIGDVDQPALQPLPEKMPEWFMDQFLQQSALENWNKVRQHFGTQPREWWMDLKKGDKFIYDYTPFNYKEIREFSELLYVEESKNYLIIDSKDVFFRIQFCSPCTDPEAEFIATLTLEQLAMYKHVKEGKG